MRQRTLIVVVGGVVFLGVGLATLPASLLASHLPSEVTAEGVSGSVWSGAADVIRLRGQPLGAASWTAEPLALLSGRLNYHVELERPDGFARGRLGASLGGALLGEDLEFDLPMSALGGGPSGSGWLGSVAAQLKTLRLENGWPVALNGHVTVAKLQPPGAQVAIGSYAIDFDPPGDSGDKLIGRVRDVDSPLLVRAQLVLKHDRSFSLEGDVTPRPGAPQEVMQAVAFLGAPDAMGRRQFVLGGSF